MAYWFNKWCRPVMVMGYRRFDGVYLPRTRVSNTTFIDVPEKFDVDDHVYIGHHNYIEASHGIRMGEGCHVTNFVSITTHSSHQSIRLYGRQYGETKEMLGYVRGSVEIGAYTFIGPNSVIMPGTRIGKGCIVAAFSFVKGTFPDFSFISGNPAMVTGDTRNGDQQILNENPSLKPFYNEWAGK